MEKTPTEILVKRQFSLKIKLLSTLLVILAIFLITSIVRKDILSSIISSANLIIAIIIFVLIKNQKQKRIDEMHEKIETAIEMEKPSKARTRKKKR